MECTLQRTVPRVVASVFFFQAEDGIRDSSVTGVQTCALPISSLAALLVREPRDVLGPHAQRRLAVEAVARRIEAEPSHGFASDEPRERYPWIVGGDARGIGAGRYVKAGIEHARDRWGGLGSPKPVALDEIFSLIRHAMLHGDAAAERCDAFDRLVRNRLRVVEEPVEARERNVLVDHLERIEGARDRLVIGRMQAPRPAVLGEDAHHLLEFVLHLRRHVGTRLTEVLEVGGREYQHLAGAVVTEVVVALLVFRGFRPVQEVRFLALRLLGQHSVSDPDGEVARFAELADDFVVFRVVLETAPRVDGPGHAEAVELAHGVAPGGGGAVIRGIPAAGPARPRAGGGGCRESDPAQRGAP